MEIKKLEKSYGQVKAVDGINLNIRGGICLGLLGPNGAGKTTSIEMMEGILSPDNGEILFRGKKIDQHFKQIVGIQFQSTALPEFITVKETLNLFRAFYPNPRPLDDLIEICSLSDIISRDNRKLSGGQRQRMLLALAIIPYPEIVFLDEPTTGLDPQARRNFWNLIGKVKAENSTIILTTHYMEEAQLLCDEVAIMDQGRILETGSPETLIARHFKGALLRIPHNGSGPDPGLGELKNGQLEIPTENLHDTLHELIHKDINLSDMQIHKPNLEDLFIKLTGSSLRN